MGEPLYKGASLVVVRQELQGKQLEGAFLAQLSRDEQERYRRVMATDWVPVTLAERIYALAAPLLYPGQPGPVRLLGREIARNHLRGIYRFMLRFTTVNFVVAQTAQLWRMYNSEGSLAVVSSEPRALTFVLTGYPTYPAVVRESLAGYIVGVIELTGAQNVRMVQSDGDPGRFEFRVTWRLGQVAEARERGTNLKVGASLRHSGLWPLKAPHKGGLPAPHRPR